MGMIWVQWMGYIKQLIKTIKLQPMDPHQQHIPNPRKPSQTIPKQPQNQSPTISQLSQKITQSYKKLQQKYSETCTQNETYLLSIYLKVLDKMLDDVVYAQERVRLIDNQTLREEKCGNYIAGIAEYRVRCQDAKGKLESRKVVLADQRKKTADLISQRDQLLDLCHKKDGELEMLKIFSKRQKQLRKLSMNKISTIQEQNEKEERPIIHPKQLKVDKSKNKKQIIRSNYNPEQKRASLSKSKSFKAKNNPKIEDASNSISVDLQQQDRTERLRNQQPKQKYKRVPVIEHLPIQKMNETLWLYQPSSYRKGKYLNSNIHHKNMQLVGVVLEQSQKGLKISGASQDSTKKDSSVDQSHIISQRSTQKSRSKL